MKGLTKYLLIAAAALCFSACDDKDEPQAPVELEVLPSDINALTDIYYELRPFDDGYPKPWNLDDRSTWENAGIEFDTLAGGKNQPPHLVISSITIYLHKKHRPVPRGLKYLSGLKDVKIYGCTGSRIIGTYIPHTVESVLIDRLDPDDPGYMEAVQNFGEFTLGQIFSPHNAFSRIVIHGLDMKKLCCKISTYADHIDLSHNTIETPPAGLQHSRWMSDAPDLSYNRITEQNCNWDDWMFETDSRLMPNLRHNLIDNIPEEVLRSEFWKEAHGQFTDNPGYRAPME